MEKVILIGHGRTGVAFKEAVEMIFGQAPAFYPLEFLPGEGIKDVTRKITDVVGDTAPEDVLVVADLFSGTPYNSAAQLALEGKIADVVSGMSLPMLLEVACNIQEDVTTVKDLIMSHSDQYVKLLSQEMQNQEEEDDF
ncbi:PTS sugar transporter subunit IIA [Ligilactobacillus saerimneri]|uniref:PTS sugar transporter subunit IIA n=1 Tax=Ligilactobacillus saerimneri TaxID=228229 RepID=UPI0024B1FCB9|nr:PTS sugar transporter subunit IIA [Ligilactobacillus saerimneri]MDI9206154.1 PTS sugar transporter subunit IIA [Ligilactobacillus saerimneri]